MPTSPEIAIVDADTLTCIGLRGLIERMMPKAVVRVFGSFEQLVRDTPDMYFHYFISARILIEHSAFFLERKEKTIVLAKGKTNAMKMAHFHTLNVFQDEESLVRSLLRLQQSAHAHGARLPRRMASAQEETAQGGDPNGLSAREVEVLTFIVSGLTNKETADRLHISINTVISHRKNLMEKLQVRSVSGLTIYAVMNGYIEADRI